ncbi:MAG: carbamoyltransferase [Balneolaceae bacterium]
MKVLGISAFYHDSAAAIVEDQTILAAAQEERFTRKKHDARFPSAAIRYCLEEAACSLNELDAIAFYDKPLLKFERLLETYYSFAPRGVESFITAMPVWLKEKMFLKRLIHQELEEIGGYKKGDVKLLFPEHHLSHAASAFYPSPFEEAAILTVDGVGEWATATISHGKGNEIRILKEMNFPHSVGLLYSAFTYYLGFRVNSGEYKLMGLAPYGDPSASETRRFLQAIREKLVTIYDDGSIWLNQDFFNYATGLEMTLNDKWEALFRIPRRRPEAELTNTHCNLAYAIQHVTEEIVCKLAATALKETGSSKLCLAGGVALNCVANGKIDRLPGCEELFIQPASGDAGGAPGAAWAAQHIFLNTPHTIQSGRDRMRGAYLGPDITQKEIDRVVRRFKATAHTAASMDEVASITADDLAAGKAVGWVQGRMEFGPRALGNRSILGDPRNPDMQKRLNVKVKYRESFRPFAPSVLAEHARHWFDLKSDSPYMLLVAPVSEEHRKPLPPHYKETDVRTQLYTERSTIPAVTHVDFSARVQTVHKETNPAYHALLEAFYQKTGVPVLVNTSFNVRGEPIVCTAEDAYRCFMRTRLDRLVIGTTIFKKEEQPAWPEAEEWKEEFTLD